MLFCNASNRGRKLSGSKQVMRRFLSLERKLNRNPIVNDFYVMLRDAKNCTDFLMQKADNKCCRSDSEISSARDDFSHLTLRVANM